MRYFNYKGVIFTGAVELDSNGHSLVLMAVYHKGEDITECLSGEIFLEMEEALNTEGLL